MRKPTELFFFSCTRVPTLLLLLLWVVVPCHCLLSGELTHHAVAGIVLLLCVCGVTSMPEETAAMAAHRARHAENERMLAVIRAREVQARLAAGEEV